MTKINAVSIAGTANDPRTIGIVGDFRKNINYLYSKQDMNNDILVALLSIISNLVYSRSSLIA
ncbi:MAG TPA: hypothetical protein VD651_01805 [Nitrosarchaeum sp.]|nr:hypothetical protein [Nitrosarchaeum sp.]